MARSSNSSRTAAFVVSALLCSAPAWAAAPTTTSTGDPVLFAMQTELAREQADLLLPGMQKPYFIEYRLDDVASYSAVANFGALVQEDDAHQRIVRVTVRIGSYQRDSSTGGRGDGTASLAATDNNPQAIRYALWSATDEAYKNALRAYSTKQASLQRFETAESQDDFAHATPVVHSDPLVSLQLDRKDWLHRITEASALYASDPEVRTFASDVQYSSATIRGLAINRYLVNSEGTSVRRGYTTYVSNINVGGQAPDGMEVSRSNGSTAVEASQLEAWPAFRQRVIDDLKSVQALRNAPVVAAEDYHGAVLFDSDAASDIVGRLFTPNVEAQRPDMGTTARTQGKYTSSYHARVLPEFINVTDNPLLTSFAGIQLIGAYDFDDEGVPAQPVPVVVEGKLQNYLVSRTPIRDFPASNGHGRAAVAQPARSNSAVLLLQSKEPLTKDALHARLLNMAKDQGHDVYEVQTLNGDAPRVLYKVHADGTRELVRGAVFDELDHRTLRADIVAAGDDYYVNNSLGAIPETTVSPSLLFDDVGVKRGTVEQQKLPYYPPPPAESTQSSK